MTGHNLKHSGNAYFPFHLRCLRLFALCFANNTFLSVFLLRPIAKLKSQLSVSQMELALPLRRPQNSGLSFPRHTLKWLCFPTAIQWHPQPGPAKKSASPSWSLGLFTQTHRRNMDV